MGKSTVEYWNVLADGSAGNWEVTAGSEEMLTQLTLAMDEAAEYYTRRQSRRSGTPHQH